LLKDEFIGLVRRPILSNGPERRVSGFVNVATFLTFEQMYAAEHELEFRFAAMKASRAY